MMLLVCIKKHAFKLNMTWISLPDHIFKTWFYYKDTKSRQTDTHCQNTWCNYEAIRKYKPIETLSLSLSCAEFPTGLTKAFLTPLIKKIILDFDIFKNYRPVPNLSFISKLMERVVCVQAVEDLKTNNLYDILLICMRDLSLFADSFTAQRQHSCVNKMIYSKPLTMREEPF